MKRGMVAVLAMLLYDVVQLQKAGGHRAGQLERGDPRQPILDLLHQLLAGLGAALVTFEVCLVQVEIRVGHQNGFFILRPSATRVPSGRPRWRETRGHLTRNRKKTGFSRSLSVS